jgi:hypothetical protein
MAYPSRLVARRLNKTSPPAWPWTLSPQIGLHLCVDMRRARATAGQSPTSIAMLARSPWATAPELITAATPAPESKVKGHCHAGFYSSSPLVQGHGYDGVHGTGIHGNAGIRDNSRQHRSLAGVRAMASPESMEMLVSTETAPEYKVMATPPCRSPR